MENIEDNTNTPVKSTNNYSLTESDVFKGKCLTATCRIDREIWQRRLKFEVFS